MRLLLNVLWGAGAGCLVVYLAFMLTGFADGTVSERTVSIHIVGLAPVFAALVCLLRAILVAGQRVLFGGLALMLSADAWGSFAYSYYADATTSFPSFMDLPLVVILPVYAAIGLAVVGSARFAVARQTLVLDSLTVALAATAAAAAFLFEPAFRDTGTDALVYAGQLAYPLADVFALGFLAAVTFGACKRPPVLLLWLLAAQVARITGNSLFAEQVARGEFIPSTAVVALWHAFGLLAARSALARPRPTPSTPRERREIDWIVPGFVGGVALVVFIAAPRHEGVGVVLAMLILAGIVTRLMIELRHVGRLWRASEVQAVSDPLTGLANRRLLMSELERAQARGLVRDTALISIDLDGFKDVNDTAGHAAGDRVLQEVARRLSRVVREGDTLARMGGDEFAVLVFDSSPETTAPLAADRILAAFEPGLGVGASIGVAVGADGLGADELLRRADMALYVAKASERGGRRVYDRSMDIEERERVRLAQELRCDGAQDEMRLEYQPIIDLASGQPVAVEALVRWQHPRRGLLGPAEFIPLAESEGSIAWIDAWVIGEAAAQIAELNASRRRHAQLSLHINVSAGDLADPGYAARVAATLRAAGLDPHRLVVEITENDLVADLESTAGALRQLRELGVQSALDDFGVGYSSLSYLGLLPVGTLKIDRSLVLPGDRRRVNLLQTIINLGDVLAMTVIAEGVETDEQQDAVARLGCRQAQGYGIARPMPLAGLRDWLARAPGADDVHLQAEPSSFAGREDRGDGPRILLVDDDVRTLDLSVRALRAHGYRTTVALSGDEARLKARATLPALVLMDLKMPQTDGFQAALEFKRDPDLAEIPVMAWSDLSPEDFGWEGHSPFAGVVTKGDLSRLDVEVDGYLATHPAPAGR